MPVQYTKLWKNGEWQKIEQDRIQRFLDEGWTLDPKSEKQSQAASKDRITAEAHVTSTKSESEAAWDETIEILDESLFDDDDDELNSEEQ
ncbi:hypothetical protein [Phage DSL-LC06]|nr:hypothetical protein [Phage DSL-LC06]